MKEKKGSSVVEMIKAGDNGKGKPETILINRGKLDEQNFQKLTYVDNKIRELETSINMLRDHRNFIVNSALTKLKLDPTGQTIYNLQPDGSIFETKEVKDG